MLPALTNKKQVLQTLQTFFESKPSYTKEYLAKNYLLLLNSFGACLTPDQTAFKKLEQKTFAIGYLEDFITNKIFFIQGDSLSEKVTLIELNKDDKKYDLSNIVVHTENAVKIKVIDFFEWLKKMIIILTDRD